MEGWTWLYNSKKWHYFVDHKSLCRKWMLLIATDLQIGNDSSPDNCKQCQKLLVKRNAEKIREINDTL